MKGTVARASFSASGVRRTDAALAVGTIVLLGVMLVPMPTFLMDILIAFNISLSLLTLLVILASGGPMELSTFPSLLLFTTLLRLALNVASTRLILLNADAGHIIQAFGDFVVGGDLVVGAVVFLILVVIQFVVITKGAGRISEVAARFTLDAMPGKQMSIDADLNAGLITNEEARKRRDGIAREAEFYGAMDGAAKFVRGDAVAGLIITAVNILGGVAIGLSRGLSLGDALSTYSILTVGDGLVSQIPALIVATSSAILVTKSATDEALGAEMISQYVKKPHAIALAAGLVGCLGLLPGLPAAPFLVLSGVLLVTYRASQAFCARSMPGGASLDAGLATKPPGPDEEAREIAELLKVDRVGIEIGYRLIQLVDKKDGGGLLDHVSMARRRFASELGIVLPPVRVKDNIQIDPGAYRILVNGQAVAAGEIRPGSLLAMNPGTASGEIEGLETVDPTFGLPARWIPEAKRQEAEVLGYTVVDSVAVLITHFTETIRSMAHELLGRDDVKTLVERLREQNPALVEDLIPGLLSLGDVQKVLKGLLLERVPIRDLARILETLAENATATKDTDTLIELCRRRLARFILEQYQDPNGTLHVVTLDPACERAMLDYAGGAGAPPGYLKKVVEATGEALRRAGEKGREPVVLVRAELRRLLSELLRSTFPRIAVLSFNEVVPATRVESLAVAAVNDAN
ncbi:MAG: flagellar biosynthesis protein FlhA [Planctomycetota bacterium]